MAAAAEAMRRILIDRARRKNSLKAGGQFHRIDLPDVASDDLLDPLPLDETLRKRMIGDVDGDGDDEVLVTVDMHAENVNIYIQDLATRAVLFGDNPTDDVAHDAALATVDFRLAIIVDEMGAPLPSWGLSPPRPDRCSTTTSLSLAMNCLIPNSSN